jgi:RNA polymerase sigma-70 factor (ECF subfamily)
MTITMLRSDPELLDGLAARRDGAFEELVEAYTGRLYGLAWRVTGSREDAEESLQDAFVRAYRALERYPTEQIHSLHLRAWLYRITLNVVRNRARRHVAAQVDIEGGLAARLAGPAAEQPAAIVEAHERRERLAREITRLPERYATAVVLRHVQGLSYAEAAVVLDQPVGTVKSDVHRGLRLLREALEREREPLVAGR